MVTVIADNIITSLGFSTEEVVAAIEKKQTGVLSRKFEKYTASPISLIDRDRLKDYFSEKDNLKYTLFERLSITSIQKAMEKVTFDLKSPDTLLIVSTTKGNIELIGEEDASIKDGLVASAVNTITKHFSVANKPLIVCNACISGVLAINLAHRLLESGAYKNIIVNGTDIASDFIVAGFESFKSMDVTPCKPFDADRRGLSLGEGSSTIILSNSPGIKSGDVTISGGSSANDANHISGPSRTGEGAYLAARRAIGELKIDYISAHGTATPYNDDMESVAIKRLGLENTPVNSFKGYFGHTLGAAGVIESVLSVYQLKNNRLYKTLGLITPGVKEVINPVMEHTSVPLKRVLKIASGFGGCNAAVVFEKE